MRVLLIDTCGAEGSVAISNSDGDGAGGVVASATLPGRSASEKLVGTVRELAAQSGIALRKLGAIAVVNGPGSFTGVRVGLSAAKGWCEALHVPLIAISRLAVLASMVEAKGGVSVFAALDAGRSEFYVGEYLDGVKVRETLATREQLKTLLESCAGQQMLVVCEGSVAGTLEELRPAIMREPDAAAALRLAVQRIECGAYDDVAGIDANYLRRTDLEIFAKARATRAE